MANEYSAAANSSCYENEGTAQPQEMIVELPPLDLPAGASHDHCLTPQPLFTAFPENGWLHGFSIEVVDAHGDTVPSAALHHVKLIAMERRELFMPIMLRLVGAGAETREVRLPPTLGLPLRKGEPLLATAMLHNPVARDLPGVRARLRLRYTPASSRSGVTEAYPFFLHVTPPDGHSGFDLPPGRTERSWEARPSVPGRIFGLGGHLHRYATELRFEDLTTRSAIWRTRPVTDEHGNVLAVPVVAR